MVPVMAMTGFGWSGVAVKLAGASAFETVIVPLSAGATG